MSSNLASVIISLVGCVVRAGAGTTTDTVTTTVTYHNQSMGDYGGDEVSVAQDSPQAAEGNGSVDVLEILLNRIALFNTVKPQVISVDKYVSVFIYCVGFPCNVLSFAVWIRKRMRHSSGCYLAALAVDDLVVLSLLVVFDLHMVWGLQPLNTPVVCQIFPIVFLAAQYLGPLLVLGFTTERYISICHPLQRKRFCSVRRARTIIAVLVCLALGLSAVQGYFYTMLPVGDKYECTPRHSTRVGNAPLAFVAVRNNGHFYTVQQTLPFNGQYEYGSRYVASGVIRGGNTSLLILWNLSIEILTFLLVPLTILLLNVLVICELRGRSRPERVTKHGHAQLNSATTVMLLTVSFYLIFTSLSATIVYSLIFEFQYEYRHFLTLEDTLKDPLFQRWVTYELVLVAIKEFSLSQCAFNFIFYMAMGRVFRNELRKLLIQVVVCVCPSASTKLTAT